MAELELPPFLRALVGRSDHPQPRPPRRRAHPLPPARRTGARRRPVTVRPRVRDVPAPRDGRRAGALTARVQRPPGLRGRADIQALARARKSGHRPRRAQGRDRPPRRRDRSPQRCARPVRRLRGRGAPPRTRTPRPARRRACGAAGARASSPGAAGEDRRHDRSRRRRVRGRRRDHVYRRGRSGLGQVRTLRRVAVGPRPAMATWARHHARDAHDARPPSVLGLDTSLTRAGIAIASRDPSATRSGRAC